MNATATHGPVTRIPEHHRGTVSGCVQVGSARLVIEQIEPDRYGAGRDGIHYRVEADIVSHWGLRPLPGAVWTYTRGITPATEAELREQVATVYGVGSTEGALLGYRGKMEGYAYRSAVSDEQARWLAARGVKLLNGGATITLQRGTRRADVRADGSGSIEGREVTAREAVAWIVAD